MMHLGVELLSEAVIETVPTLDWLEILMLVAIAVVCALYFCWEKMSKGCGVSK